MAALETLSPVTNDAASTIEISQPYIARFRVEGVAPFLFHRWSNEDVAIKGAAAKGSKTKKTDNIESYVFRADNGELAIPLENFRMACVTAAKFRQDPRSPRKSAMDLFKAGLAGVEELCCLGTDEWDYLDQRRVRVQSSAITRTRPAMKAGWSVSLGIIVLLPEYIGPQMLNETMQQAGRLQGVGDFRPTYGRFNVTSFEVQAA